jgi:hypothetical protein
MKWEYDISVSYCINQEKIIPHTNKKMEKWNYYQMEAE